MRTLRHRTAALISAYVLFAGTLIAQTPGWEIIKDNSGGYTGFNFFNAMQGFYASEQPSYRLYYSDDGFVTQSQVTGPTPVAGESLNAYYALSENELIAVYIVSSGWKIYKSMDRGANWSEYAQITTPGVSLGFNGVVNNRNAIKMATPDFWYVNHPNSAVADDKIRVSTDAGLTWSVKVKPYDDRSHVSFSDANNGFLAFAGNTNNGRVYRTSDGGSNWTEVTSPFTPGTGLTEAVTVKSISNNDAYAAFGGSGQPRIFRTSDAGQNWTDVTPDWASLGDEGISISNVSALSMEFIDPQNGLFGARRTNNKPVLIRTVDGGATWTLEEFEYPANPSTAVNEIIYLNAEVQFMRAGRFIYRIGEDSPSSVNQSNANEEKVRFYPNPMTDHATLALEGAPVQNTTLSVYDSMGRLVSTESGLNGNRLRIDRQGMAPGHYSYMLTDGGMAVSIGRFSVE